MEEWVELNLRSTTTSATRRGHAYISPLAIFGAKSRSVVRWEGVTRPVVNGQDIHSFRYLQILGLRA